MKKISVIIPVYNSETYLQECINSVINQTYENLEIIIINNASTDNSFKIINQYKDNRIKIIKLKKKISTSQAYLKGLEESTGDYICFINNNDYWYDFKIKKQINYIEKNKYELIYSNSYLKKKDKLYKTNIPQTINYDMTLENSELNISTIMIDSKSITQIKDILSNLDNDYETYFLLQLLKNIDKAYGMQDILSVHRIDKINNSIKTIWNIYNSENIKFNIKIKHSINYILNKIKRRV